MPVVSTNIHIMTPFPPKKEEQQSTKKNDLIIPVQFSLWLPLILVNEVPVLSVTVMRISFLGNAKEFLDSVQSQRQWSLPIVSIM